MSFAHNDHLKQGEGRSRSSKSSGSHREQGPTGAGRSKSSGSHMDQGEGRARSSRASGSHLDSGPNVPGSDSTAVRGGGGRHGHDRTNPSAGKSKSGSKNAQHPNNRRSKR